MPANKEKIVFYFPYPILHPVLSFVYSFIFCIIIGILTHPFIEKPSTKLLISFYNLHNLKEKKGTIQ